MRSNLTKRKIVLIFTVLQFCIFNAAFGQFVPISLAQRIEKSTTIFEGKVISQSCYWDETKTHIYTSNVVEVYKIFKGKLTSLQVEIITRGGIVDNDMERIYNTLELKIGDIGIFTAIASTTKIKTKSNLTKLKAYAGMQGFIKYDLASNSAKDVFNEYINIKKELYPKIETLTKTNMKTIKKNTF
jgi:hypothetical protein